MLAERSTLDECSQLVAEIAARGNLDNLIPTLARDPATVRRIESIVQRLPTKHNLIRGDSRELDGLDSGSVHLAVTSPPYWTLRRSGEHHDRRGWRHG